MGDLTSSQAIIKALKGAEDPPTPGGLSKIAIAQRAWESTSIHFPNKDEMLTEWILSSFLRHNKDAWSPNGKGLVLSAPHWLLLRDILSVNPPSQNARQSRVWLSPLLNRISVLNIVTIFLKCASDSDLGHKRDLVDGFTRCMHVLWPLATVRMSLDSLTDCFGSILEYLSSDATQLNILASVCVLVTRSFKQAVGNTSSKKKAFSWFTQQNFLHWVHVMCIESSTPIILQRDAKIFKSEVYQAGIDVFFCLDFLKGSKDPLETLLTDPKLSISSIQSTQLQVVPMLYRSYIQEMRKHRLAVFGSGSNQGQEQTVQNKLRDAGMRAIASCYKVLRDYGDILEVWKSVSALLEVLEEANLVGHGLSEKREILNDIATSAVDVLAEPKGDRVARSEAALQILCILSRIDFDIINPLLPETLSGLLTMNPTLYPSAQILLHEIVDFHSKTRTMPSYLALLLGCFTKNPVDGKVATQYTVALSAHRDCTSGALLSARHLESLSRCIKSFLTPGQTQEVVDSALATLQNTWKAYLGGDLGEEDAMNIGGVGVQKESSIKDSEGKKQKRRETSSMEPSFSASMSSMERASLAYSLIARAVAVILPSLPFSTLSESTYASIRTSISDAWSGDIAKAARTAFTVSESPSERWAAQSVSSAAFRIRHALIICPALRSLDPLGSSPIVTENYVAFIRSFETIPELVIELFGAFFDVDFRNANSEKRDTTIEALFAYLTTNLGLSDTLRESDPQTQAFWDASTSSLDLLEPGGHARGALAIWHLLLDRWLPVLDEIASPEGLKTLACICLSDHSANNIERAGELSYSWVLERTMRSAAFWELANLRDAMISEMDSATSHAGWSDFSELLKQVRPSSKLKESKKGSSSSSVTAWSTRQVRSVYTSFSLLLRAPREYLPRNARITFFRRALVADLAVFLFEKTAAENAVDVGRKTKTVIRATLVSMSDAFSVADVVEELRGYVEYLMHSETKLDDSGVDFNTITLELLSSLFRQIIRSAIHGKEDQLKSLCTSLQNCSSSLSEQSLLQFIELLIAQCSSMDKVSPSCVEAVKGLHSSMHTRYSLAMLAILSSASNLVTERTLTIRSWRMCLVLRKWLHVTEATSFYGAKLIPVLTALGRDLPSKDAALRNLGTQIFMLILEELHTVSTEEREKHLALIVSSNVLLLGRLHLADRDVCDVALGRAVRSMSVNEFAFAHTLLREALAKGLAGSGEIQTAVHVSSILLGDAPEGALKATQEHFEECLHIFSADSKFVTGDPELSFEVLAFIGKVCSDKPASLRLLGVGSIWLLLAKLLVGSTTHTSESHERMLHAITSIAGSLVRLRRDLVTSTLPHLGAILSALLRTLCAPRAQLGARQRALVANTLPWWIAPSTPFGPPEARAVARLLTSLQAKTVPRTFTSRGREKDKERGAEALLGAFSKHAGPVLGAYIGALVDPLVMIDAGVREALAPGLYTLCEAMGEHGRDALMAGGLDASGRTVLKALWREYERQRYVGKG